MNMRPPKITGHLSWVFLLLFAVPNVHAQTGRAAKDSLKLVVKELRQRLSEADSSNNTPAAIEIGSELASIVEQPEAIKLLQKASNEARDAQLLDKEISVRNRLAELYRSSGKMAEAYREALLINDLNEKRADQHALLAQEQNIAETARLTTQRDSLASLLVFQRSREADSTRTMEARQRTWMWATLLIGVLWLLSVAYLFHRIGRVQRGATVAMASVSAEVNALKERQANSFREEAKVRVPLTGTPSVATTTIPFPGSLDPVLVAMFRKAAPERLATLQAARERGDMEKVVRVVHTLKPQLVGIDAARFAHLCAYITSAESQADPVRWNASLDELQQGIVLLQEGLA